MEELKKIVLLFNGEELFLLGRNHLCFLKSNSSCIKALGMSSVTVLYVYLYRFIHILIHILLYRFYECRWKLDVVQVG